MVNLKITDSHTGIPYQPCEHPGGDRNYGYVDLKKHPNKVESIPELMDSPELCELVRELNHSRSLFRSVGVEKSLSPSGDDTFPFKRTSFTIFVFEILDWNHEENWRRLHQEFGTHVAAESLNWTDTERMLIKLEIEINWVTFNDHNALRKRGCTFWVDGFGRTEKEAMDCWRLGIRSLQSFSFSARQRFHDQLDKGYKLITQRT